LGPETAAVLSFRPCFQGLFQAAGKHTQICLIAGRSPGLTAERFPHSRAGLIAFTLSNKKSTPNDYSAAMIFFEPGFAPRLLRSETDRWRRFRCLHSLPGMEEV
jgi:hypothetical protein